MSGGRETCRYSGHEIPFEAICCILLVIGFHQLYQLQLLNLYSCHQVLLLHSLTDTIVWVREALLQYFANTVESGNIVRRVLGCPVTCSSSRSDDLVFSIKQQLTIEFSKLELASHHVPEPTWHFTIEESNVFWQHLMSSLLRA